MLGCIVMACGEGTRFAAAGGNGDKLLADVAGLPLIVRTVASVPCEHYRTVMPVRALRVASAVRAAALPVEPVMSPVAHIKRSAVIRLGMRALAGARHEGDWDGVLFLPGDQPLVSTASFEALAHAHRNDPTRIYRLSWQGRMGSPVVFPRSCFPALMRLQGSEGGGAVIRAGSAPVVPVEAKDAFELQDVDTPADLERVRSAMAGR